MAGMASLCGFYEEIVSQFVRKFTSFELKYNEFSNIKKGMAERVFAKLVLKPLIVIYFEVYADHRR